MAFSLKAILGLETTSFERGLGRARSKLSSSVGIMMKSLAPLAGFIGFSTMANDALNLSREITNLSKVANAEFEDFQKRAFAAKTVGVEMEKLADIYKDAGDKIGDFLQTGGGPLADFFENIAPKIGVTAEQFRELSGPDALQLYYDSIEKANLSQNEMTFFMEAIASDAALLIPLMKDGGKAFEEFGKKAEDAGLIMSKLKSERLEKVNLKMDVWKKRATILTGTFITKLIPALKILSSGLGFVADMFGIAASNILAFGKAIGRVITAAVQPAIGQMKALGLAIQAASQAAGGNFDDAAKSIKKAQKAAVDGAKAIKDIPSEMKAAAEELKVSVEAGFKVLGDVVDERGTQITDAFKDIKGEANEAEDAIADVIIAANKASEGGGGTKREVDGKGALIELEQKLRKIKLAILKAETRGQEDAAKSLRKRLELAEKIVKIMQETGATQREATIIANSQSGGDSGSTSSSESRKPSRDPRSGFRSRFGAAPTLEERERAAGLYLAGNDPLSGRRGPEDMSSAGKGSNGVESMTKSILDAQDKTTKEIKKLRTDPVS